MKYGKHVPKSELNYFTSEIVYSKQHERSFRYALNYTAHYLIQHHDPSIEVDPMAAPEAYLSLAFHRELMAHTKNGNLKWDFEINHKKRITINKDTYQGKWQNEEI